MAWLPWAPAGTWGDHVTLQAAADAYGVRICILTSFLSDAVISIDPMVLRSEDDLWLAFWAEVRAPGRQLRWPRDAWPDAAPGGQLPRARACCRGERAFFQRRRACKAKTRDPPPPHWMLLQVHYNSIVPRQPTPPSKSSSGKKLANAFRSLSPF